MKVGDLVEWKTDWSFEGAAPVGVVVKIAGWPNRVKIQWSDDSPAGWTNISWLEVVNESK